LHKPAALLLALTLTLSTACTGRTAEPTATDKTAAVSVVVTFDALYELASAIGGDRVNVVNIMPPGADAHHFEPRPKDIALLGTADVFLVCGLGFDPWAQDVIDAAGNNDLTVCEASRGIVPIELSGDAHGLGPGNSINSDDDRGSYDPHAWLSISCAKLMVENIRDALILADPGGAEYFRDNSNMFIQKLDGLFDEYSEKFSALQNRTLVTGHAVFAYLCRDFSLEQNSVEGVFAEGEPNARALSELIDFCRANNITVILAESQSSPLVAETLAAEAGASVRMIYTMETPEEGLTYIERMERNLATIYESMKN